MKLDIELAIGYEGYVRLVVEGPVDSEDDRELVAALLRRYAEQELETHAVYSRAPAEPPPAEPPLPGYALEWRPPATTRATRAILKGSREHKRWSPEETQFIRENYKQMSDTDMAALLERVPLGVQRRRSVLGLLR